MRKKREKCDLKRSGTITGTKNSDVNSDHSITSTDNCSVISVSTAINSNIGVIITGNSAYITSVVITSNSTNVTCSNSHVTASACNTSTCVTSTSDTCTTGGYTTCT